MAENFKYSALVWSGSLLFGCLCLSLLLFSGLGNIVTFVEWEFFSGWGFSFSVLVLVDTLSVGFSFVVCLVSSCVFMYSMSYMKEDKFIGLFSVMVGCFVVAMNVLIYVPHLAFMLLGWDLLGIVSFLLVIFYQNSASVGAGVLTILVNRLGDVFLLMAISLISVVGTWGPLSESIFQSDYAAVAVAGLLVSACMTKSAQVPFSVWLPAAMAAPTPVSALVHSSTLVTAGVYIMFRYYPFFSAMDGVLLLSSKIGCLTLLMASLAACFEVDIKKLIALSTLSHLGFMVYVLGLGYPVLSFFHMVMHALFKSLLFLCAGCYIHAMGSCQDLRHLSGAGWVSSPLLVSCFVIGFSSLCGIPYLSGFYSKDAILEVSLESLSGVLEVMCIMLSASISYVYSMRVLLKTIFSSFSSVPSVLVLLEESFISIPLCLLGVSSVVAGFVAQSVWVESCQTFFMSQTSKMMVFFALNSGGLIVMLEFINPKFLQKSEILTKCYMTLMKMCASMWFLRWIFGQVPEVWYKSMSKTMSVLELGWMEVLGGYWAYFTLSGVSMKLWMLERVSILLILRFSLIFFLFFYSLL
uniref:NADH-ubiquinone oxidoreductase chain 5 n=1 Tax=Pyganodon grandis TaxID=96932 RepID=D2DW48_PYGGR|nr:NADH dehydrogenase subunit 5 [Pyganodon grandis]